MPATSDSSETDNLLQMIAAGNRDALGKLIALHRDYLRRVVDARMEPGLRRKLDPSDVVQETLEVVNQRIDDYLERRPATFRLWLRGTALEQLINARRHHRAQKRSLERDVRISDASSLALARAFAGSGPADRLLRSEVAGQVRLALAALTPFDQDILIMRHGEGLSNADIAELLQVDPKTASKRYGRALQRLATQLAKLGFSNG
jgi:RNA polymerase sigma-70 factor, ECF subfamily